MTIEARFMMTIEIDYCILVRMDMRYWPVPEETGYWVLSTVIV